MKKLHEYWSCMKSYNYCFAAYFWIGQYLLCCMLKLVGVFSRGGRGGVHTGISQHSVRIFTDICSQVYLPSFKTIGEGWLHTVIPPPLSAASAKIAQQQNDDGRKQSNNALKTSLSISMIGCNFVHWFFQSPSARPFHVRCRKMAGKPLKNAGKYRKSDVY